MPLIDFILLLALFVVFIVILAGLALLVYLGMKKSREAKSQFTVLVISSQGSPLPDIDVKLGGEIATTDSYGKAQFNIKPGEHELLMVAEGHADFRQKIRVGEKRVFSARLSKDSLHGETRQLEAAIASARQGREEIAAGYNSTIPDYMFGICLALHRMALEEARAQPDKKLRLEILKSASLAISQTAKGMVERRNLTLYANAKGKKVSQLDIPQPRSSDVAEGKKMLSHVDILLTRRAGKSAIYPPQVLWKTAQKLLSDPLVFNVKLAVFLLDSAEKMILELDDYLA